MFIDNKYRLFSTGFNRYGRLGHGDEKEISKFTLIMSLRNKKIIDAQCGYFHTAAVTKDGHLYSWGYGNQGRLGLGYDEFKRSNPNSLVPKRIEQGIEET
jgi:alpha-tubulin suppressor-like RCC1 family protein